MTVSPFASVVCRRIPVAVLLLALASAVGCGGPPAGTVQGKVTLNGTDLDGGRIRFTPTVPGKGATGPVETDVKGGAYTLSLPPGEYKVEITCNKVVGKKKAYDTPDSPLVDSTEEAVPDVYNTKTDLKYTVAAGPNAKDFELKGKAK